MRKILEKAEEGKLENLQNIFNKLGAMKMVLAVISENKNLDSDLLINYLLFANKMLEEGN